MVKHLYFDPPVGDPGVRVTDDEGSTHTARLELALSGKARRFNGPDGAIYDAELVSTTLGLDVVVTASRIGPPTGILLVKYNDAGEMVWARNWTTTQEQVHALGIDASGNIGVVYGPLGVGSPTRAASFDSTGQLRWAYHWDDGAATFTPQDITFGLDGSVHLVGFGGPVGESQGLVWCRLDTTGAPIDASLWHLESDAAGEFVSSAAAVGVRGDRLYIAGQFNTSDFWGSAAPLVLGFTDGALDFQTSWDDPTPENAKSYPLSLATTGGQVHVGLDGNPLLALLDPAGQVVNLRSPQVGPQFTRASTLGITWDSKLLATGPRAGLGGLILPNGSSYLAPVQRLAIGNTARNLLYATQPPSPVSWTLGYATWDTHTGVTTLSVDGELHALELTQTELELEIATVPDVTDNASGSVTLVWLQ